LGLRAANAYTIVSQDVDFAELAMLLPPPPKVIWVRIGNQPSSAIAKLLRYHAELIVAFENDDAVCLEIY
jgi:predicted nuclease of predicted toxin-antitoxin system